MPPTTIILWSIKSVGFANVVVERHHRMFFSSAKCGALAIAFLSTSLMNTMLPSSDEESEVIHHRFRAIYCTVVLQQQTVTRPWIWGCGDAANDHHPGSSSDLSVSVGASHRCVSI